MPKKRGNFVSYTLDELKRMKSQTDWARVAATTQEEVERQIASDPDDWLTDANAVLIRGIPPMPNKQRVNIRLDREVLDYFRASGRGYQTRINQVLKVFVRRAGKKDVQRATAKRGAAARAKSLSRRGLHSTRAV
jgi:uncharacterized protein (DUF4415 family)